MCSMILVNKYLNLQFSHHHHLLSFEFNALFTCSKEKRKRRKMKGKDIFYLEEKERVRTKGVYDDGGSDGHQQLQQLAITKLKPSAITANCWRLTMLCHWWYWQSTASSLSIANNLQVLADGDLVVTSDSHCWRSDSHWRHYDNHWWDPMFTNVQWWLANGQDTKWIGEERKGRIGKTYLLEWIHQWGVVRVVNDQPMAGIQNGWGGEGKGKIGKSYLLEWIHWWREMNRESISQSVLSTEIDLSKTRGTGKRKQKCHSQSSAGVRLLLVSQQRSPDQQ